ncbi:MAG: hypothetical protein AMXMBFR75_32460 [Candidatus Hinthialibacteria bacterium]
MPHVVHTVQAFKAKPVELSNGELLIPELREVSGRLVIDCRLWFHPGRDTRQARRPSRSGLPIPPQDMGKVAAMMQDLAEQLSPSPEARAAQKRAVAVSEALRRELGGKR